MLRGTLLLWLVLTVQLCFCQAKTVKATKAVQAPVADGLLTDVAWQSEPATGFVQNSPNFGQPATTNTEARIAYDDNAIYVSAFLHDDPALIRRQLTARDGEARQNADYFFVAFDTYNDQQNGFLFLVTPSNVQTDQKIGANTAYGYGVVEGDRSWDAVWQSTVKTVAGGWVVEMRIPYISLRFAKKAVQTWGLQFGRYSRRNNEASTWNPVNPAESGFVNQFGKCEDLADIQPPLRLSLSPYLTTGVRFYPEGSDNKRDFLRNGGMDVKYGINESFTLDATLVPDFGQVISDNLINNLTPFEIKFQENRPFFTEGTELFNKSGLFYSRRIGAIPTDYFRVQNLASRYSIQSNPSVTQLYNAIKLSGRTRDKLGIGLFNAVTAPARATLTNRSSGKDSVVTTEPLTNYNLFVLDKALRGRSSITFTNASVLRNGADRDANVSSLDVAYYTKNNRYLVRTSAKYSKIFGYSPFRSNINLIKDTITINNRLLIKPYDGFCNTFFAGKVSGKVQASFSTIISSAKYDPNDLGYLPAANEVSYNGRVSYNQQTATATFNSYSYSIGYRHAFLFKPYAYNSFEVYARAFWVLKSFVDFHIALGTQPVAQHDYFELRTAGRYLERPAFRYVSVGGSTDSRKNLFIDWEFGYARTDVEGGDYTNISVSARQRFSNRFTLTLDVTNQNDANQIGYAFLREANGEPIISYRRNLETQSVLSGIYNFAPRLNLTLRTRHYWNEVAYKKFFNVDGQGKPVARPFITDQGETYNLFNVDAFLTWDFRPGSRFIVGYKNWLGNPYAVTSPRSYFGNLKNTFSTSHGNELTAKFIYFLDYNQFRKKR